MLQSLSQRFSGLFRDLLGKGTLTESNIAEALNTVRHSLQEADCASEAIHAVLDKIRAEVIGMKVPQGLNPTQAFIKIVHDRLVAMMGAPHQGWSPSHGLKPEIILMAGLQGSGKTTSTAKLARYLKEKHGQEVMVVSCDIYRPAAMEQLSRLVEGSGITCYAGAPHQKPREIAEQAWAQARAEKKDVLIVDTAGRLTIDTAMMEEIQSLAAFLKPKEVFFVVDGMIGQSAARTAAAFHQAIHLTGVIVTKCEGDARLGALLSMRHMTHGVPIRWIGVGEKPEASTLEAFHPERMVSRMLGMGDMLSFLEQWEQHGNKQDAERMMRKIQKGKNFDFDDFRMQIQQMNKMGGIEKLMGQLPLFSDMMPKVEAQFGEKTMRKTLALINAMTPQERRHPSIIRGGRVRRIAVGTGVGLPEVHKLLKQFEQMQKGMKQFAGGGLSKMLNKLPPGMLKNLPGSLNALQSLLPGASRKEDR